jgi:trk system potassium uptake protein
VLDLPGIWISPEFGSSSNTETATVSAFGKLSGHLGLDRPDRITMIVRHQPEGIFPFPFGENPDTLINSSPTSAGCVGKISVLGGGGVPLLYVSGYQAEIERLVNLSSLSFFHSLRADHRNKQFAVIGLGRFGRAVAHTLHQQGYDVLCVDTDESKVAQILSDRIATHARQLDSTQPAALKEAGIFEQDTVIVAIGNYVQESIITTLNVKEGGVPHVVAKASSEIHVKLLKKVGADHVVFPEYEMGCELARSLTRPGILDRFDLDPENSIVEVIVPEQFDGKTIADLKFRSSYGLSLLAIGHNGKFAINPTPSQRLEKGSLMVVIGSNQNIDRLPI